MIDCITSIEDEDKLFYRNIDFFLAVKCVLNSKVTARLDQSSNLGLCQASSLVARKGLLNEQSVSFDQPGRTALARLTGYAGETVPNEAPNFKLLPVFDCFD